MNIAVIAANGRSGKQFVELALAAGHNVSAGVHRSNNLKSHERLNVITCDATNINDLTNLLKDQDAVVSFIGHVRGSPPSVQTDAMRSLIAVMSTLGLRRIVSLTGTGVRFPGDKITLLDRVLNLSIGVIDPARIKDGHTHMQVLQNSNLDWTVIRVLKLQNTQAKPFSLLAHGPTKGYVSRNEVAQAVLQVLTDGSFITQAPIIGKASHRSEQ